jgi:phosphoribosyl-AMP cyclohydrolase
MNMQISEIKFDSTGLIPAIVQDAENHQVLMMAYMNADSLKLTIEKGETIFWSRSRNELWHKGATSGNIQKVIEIKVDCDADTLLILVQPAGPACHTGEKSCFYRSIEERS